MGLLVVLRTHDVFNPPHMRDVTGNIKIKQAPRRYYADNIALLPERLFRFQNRNPCRILFYRNPNTTGYLH